jgi:predicted AAA+ superfamily ATPase
MSNKIISKGVLTACKPRKEVLEGELDDAIFAADFGQLVDGGAPKVYGHAETFFRNTEPTPDLKAVCTAVFKALANRKEGGQLIRLSTGFGGGKTHTLMALWHLAQNVGKLTLGTELLPAAGRPKSVTVVAVDAGKAGVPVFATHGKTKTHSLQGEIFFHIGEQTDGGTEVLKTLGPADSHEGARRRPSAHPPR